MSTTLECDRRQIRRAAIAMAVGRYAEVDSVPGCGLTVAQAPMVPECSLDPRFARLQESCGLLAEGFAGFDAEIAEYVRTVPLDAHDLPTADTERFLDWLSERGPLTDEQQDLVVCQRSRHAVEFVALKQRLAHVRFQAQLAASENLLHAATPRSRLTVHFNPIHVWATFQTRRLLSDDDEVPATVLFFPVGRDIRTAVVTDDVAKLLHTLERVGTQKLRSLTASLDGWPREEVLDLLTKLCELGIIAVG